MKKILLTLSVLCFLITSSFSQTPDLETIKALKDEIRESYQHQLTNKQSYNANTRDTDAYGDPPQWDWVQKIGGDGADMVQDFVEGPDGNFHFTGSFSGDISLIPGDFSSQGVSDMFIASCTPNGILIDFKQYPAGENEYLVGHSIDIDTDGGIYVSGYFTGSTDAFDVNTLTTNNPGQRAAFLARINADNTTTWAIKYEDNNEDRFGTKLELINNSEILLLIKSNPTDLGYLTRFYTDGNLINEYTSFPIIQDFDVHDDKVYITGEIANPTDFGATTLTPTSIYTNSYVAQSDTDLIFNWASMVSNVDFGDSRANAVVANDDACFITGDYRGQAFFGATEAPAYQAGLYYSKLDTDGNFLWASFADDIFSGGGDPGLATIDNAGNLISVGNLNLFLPLSNGSELSTNKESYWFQLNGSDGAFMNAVGIIENVKALGLSSSGKIITAGDYWSDLSISQRNAAGSQTDWEIISVGPSGYASGYLGHSMGVDDQANTYLAGEFKHDFIAGSNQLFSRYQSIAVTKSDAEGNVLWANGLSVNYGRLDIERGALAPDGAFWVAGIITGITNTILGDFAGDRETFLARFNSNGILTHFTIFGFTEIYSIKFDSNGELIISGTYPDELTIQSQSLTSAGANDAFVAKFNSAGSLLWLKSIGGEDMEYLGIVDLDSNDNIYFTAEVHSVDFVAGSVNLTLEEGDGNIVLMKLDPEGNAQWAKVFGGGDTDNFSEYLCWPMALKVDANNEIYMTGMIGWDNDFGGTQLTNPFWNGAGLTHALNWFVSKLDTEGNVTWVDNINHRQFLYPSFQIDTDPLGNLYVGGSFRDSVYFIDNSVALTPSAPSQRNGLLIKYDPLGTVDWIKSMEGSGINLNGVAVVEEDQVVISGDFQNFITFEPNLSFVHNSNNWFTASTGDLSTRADYLHPTYFDLAISPNPFNKDFQLTLDLETASKVELHLYHVTGQLVQTFSSLDLPTGENQSILLQAKESLPFGIYFLQVKIGDVFAIQKIEKM